MVKIAYKNEVLAGIIPYVVEIIPIRYIGRLLDHVDKPPSQVTQDHIAAYLDSEDDVIDSTRMHIIDALRVFSREFLDLDVADAFEMPRNRPNPRRPHRKTTDNVLQRVSESEVQGALPRCRHVWPAVE